VLSGFLAALAIGMAFIGAIVSVIIFVCGTFVMSFLAGYEYRARVRHPENTRPPLRFLVLREDDDWLEDGTDHDPSDGQS
jgi:hypothetical protein